MPSPKFERWEWLFEELQKINPEKKKAAPVRTDAEKSSSVTENSQPQSTEFSSSPISSMNGIPKPPFVDLSNSDSPFVSSAIADTLKEDIESPAVVKKAVAEIVKTAIPLPDKNEKKMAKQMVRANRGNTGLPATRLFVYHICGYTFRYNPADSELSIAPVHEDLYIKIKRGNFPEGGDFALLNKRLVKSSDQSETPFLLEISANEVCVTDATSYMSLHFPIIK